MLNGSDLPVRLTLWAQAYSVSNPHILRLCLKSKHLNGFIKIDLQLRELYARSYIEYSKFLVFTSLHVLHKAHEQII